MIRLGLAPGVNQPLQADEGHPTFMSCIFEDVLIGCCSRLVCPIQVFESSLHLAEDAFDMVFKVLRLDGIPFLPMVLYHHRY